MHAYASVIDQICGMYNNVHMCFIIIQIICLGMAIAAAVAISAVNDLDDVAHELGGEFRHADSYRGAAGWVLFVGIAAIIYHGIMIFIRALYFTSNINISNSFVGYSFTVSDHECGIVEFTQTKICSYIHCRISIDQFTAQQITMLNYKLHSQLRSSIHSYSRLFCLHKPFEDVCIQILTHS